MLGKLLKNEFSATAKVYLPLYGLLLILTVVNKAFSLIRHYNMDLPQGIAFMGYALVLGAIMVMTLVLTIQRFHKNILGDEGYLMHTLPVEKWQLVLSKLLVATAWTLLAGAVAILSIVTLAYTDTPMQLLQEVSRLFAQLFIHVPAMDIILFSCYGILFVLLAIFAGYLPIYFAMALGYTSNKNKLLSSVAWYLALSFIWQTITTIGAFVSEPLGIARLFLTIREPLLSHLLFLAGIVYLAVLNAVCFFGTTYLLKHKLNLE